MPHLKWIVLLLVGQAVLSCPSMGFAVNEKSTGPSVPVIDVTDIYHPYQDPQDNFDLIAAYALPEIDLRAIVFDVTEEYRKPRGQVEGLPADNDGPREPGFIPVAQLNRIFDRNVPCAAAPFGMMRSPEDKMLEAPSFEQAGIELMIRTLREATEPVEIVSFGSGRPVAVAYNREPKLFREKVKLIHLSAGSSEAGFMEWNVMLDQKSIVRLLKSDLPIAIYPCGTKEGAFAYGPGNTFWRLADLKFLPQMAQPLQQYCHYLFEREDRSDFLRAVENTETPTFTSGTLNRFHNVWETGIWLNVARRKLVRRESGRHEIVREADVLSTDTVFPNELKPCKVEVRDNGEFVMSATSEATNKWMYNRGDGKANEAALREAFVKWYSSISPGR